MKVIVAFIKPHKLAYLNKAVSPTLVFPQFWQDSNHSIRSLAVKWGAKGSNFYESDVGL